MDIYSIKDPTFLKDLSINELNVLAKDIRQFIIENVSKTGGHLSSNLGIVELTIALHKVFDSPNDKIFFDVGHQSYTHKILTGRADQFHTLRQYQGLSGFQKRCESSYDAWEAGHSSTALSAAVGMALARDLNHDHYEVIPVIGDAAMVGGASLEALNHLGSTRSKVIIILNDNQMSISKNVGGVNDFLSELRTSMTYNKAKQEYKEMLSHVPLGTSMYRFSYKLKERLKNKIINDTIFTEFGVDYLGPIDGHDFKDLLRALNKAKYSSRSIVVHVLTKKGKGYSFAENDKSGKWHGVGPFNIETGQMLNVPQNKVSWSEVVSSQVYKLMAFDKDIVCVTPAMINGSKLNKIFENYPDRSFDVGIAEQHAVTFSAGLAISNKKPFLSIYSSFLQRAYDQVNHDLARMKLPILLSIDRSGLVGADGETHHGVFDIGFLMGIPNIIYFTPSNTNEAKQFINTAFYKNDGPYLIRVSKEYLVDEDVLVNDYIEIGTWTKPYTTNNAKIAILTYDDKINRVISHLKANNSNVDVINARFFKPMDEKMLISLQQDYEHLIVYETDIRNASLGLYISEFYAQKNLPMAMTLLAIENHYTPQGTVDELLKLEKLNLEKLDEVIKKVNK